MINPIIGGIRMENENNNVVNDIDNQTPITSSDNSSFAAEPVSMYDNNNQYNDFNASMPNNFKEKKSFKGLIIGGVVVVVLLVVGLVVANSLMKTKKESVKEVFEQSVNKQIATMNEVYSEFKPLELANKFIQVKGTGSIELAFSTNIEMLKDFQDYKFSLEMGHNGPEKKIALNGVISIK